MRLYPNFDRQQQRIASLGQLAAFAYGYRQSTGESLPSAASARQGQVEIAAVKHGILRSRPQRRNRRLLETDAWQYLYDLPNRSVWDEGQVPNSANRCMVAQAAGIQLTLEASRGGQRGRNATLKVERPRLLW